ncbi:MAG: YDG domain-containing protein, partial [Proteobacteria bacterium]|nr:YDG domain-containing protein [Pseudomonadota bacterium]
MVLQAHNDITLSNALNIVGFGGVTPGTLTLQAGRSVLLNASISTSNGNLNLIANDKAANGVVDANRDAGVAQMTQAAGTTINAGTGSVSIDLRDGAGLTNRTAGTVTLASISADSLSVQSPVFTASASAVSKTYDTTTTAAMTSPSVSGLALQTGSNLSLGTPAGNFADKNVGTNKTVTSDAFVLVGFNGAATSKPQAAGADLIATTTANIGVKAIQVAGLSAQDKVYDASADTTLSGSASLTGILGSDSVSIGGGTPTSGTFSDKNVGASKSVSASIAGINLTGADAGNYQVTDFASSFAASISKADLTVAGLAAQ